ncbi:MAG: hypothetical protein OXT67_01990 [Zetaproteobacteria bacterium]|nr:hypothetical protein [Zetaproteobacteria bacterium]
MGEKQNVIRISDPARIRRILEKASSTHIPILMRDLSNPKTAVRGECKGLGDMMQTHNDSPKTYMHVCRLSERGLQYLQGKTQIKLEFTVASLKLVCAVEILKKNTAERSLLLTVPNEIYSFERRNMIRHQVNKHYPVFVSIPHFNAISHNLLNPPTLPHMAHLAKFIGSSDISLGGICLESFFPGFLKNVTRDQVVENVILQLPMQSAYNVDLKYCWIKAAPSNPLSKKSSRKRVKIFSVGCSFENPDEPLIIGIRRYVQQVQEMESI